MTPTRRQEPEDDDLEDLQGFAEETPKPRQQKESFVQRIGLTGLIGGAAALITAIAALISALNGREGHQPEVPPASTATGFTISDYWYGTPVGTDQPLIFHLLVNESPATPASVVRPATVSGTMRNPCQSDSVVRIQSGSWDGSHLTVHVTETGSGRPVTLDVLRAADLLEGSVMQGGYDGRITMHRGETGCPGR